MSASPTTGARDFLLTVLAAGGGGQSLLLLAARLVARGHRVRILGEEGQRAAALATGSRFAAWEHLPAHQARASLSDAQETPIDAREELRRLSVLLGEAAAGFAAATMHELDREPAEAVITLDMLHGVMALCEAGALPLAVISASISPFPIPGVPPFGAGLLPPKTPQDEEHQRVIAREIEEIFDAALPGLNRARRGLGLPELAHLADSVKSGIHYLCTARSFDFAPAVLPRHVCYAGPLLDRSEVAWQSPWGANDERALVLVAFSTTFQNQVDVLQRVIDACARLPIAVLLTLGSAIAPDAVKPAANTHIVAHAPHMAVMRRASAVITHGGHGTVMAALVRRLPLLVIPQGRDQYDNAVRITERGAGLALPPSTTPQQITAAVTRLLDEPQFKAGAVRLGDAVALEERDSTLVSEIEALAASSAVAEQF